jgi:hypothetical protein
MKLTDKYTKRIVIDWANWKKNEMNEVLIYPEEKGYEVTIRKYNKDWKIINKSIHLKKDKQQTINFLKSIAPKTATIKDNYLNWTLPKTFREDGQWVV